MTHHQDPPPAEDLTEFISGPLAGSIGITVRLWQRGDRVSFEVWQHGPEHGADGRLVWRQGLLPRTYRLPWPRLLAEQLADQVADRDNQGWPELR